MKRFVVVIVVVAALAAFAALWVVGRGGDRGLPTLGEPAGPQARSARIGDIVQNPRAYRDQVVVVEGRIGAVGCVDCGGVIVTDKTWRLPVEPEDPSKFRIPVKQGAAIKVWGVVHVEGAEEEKAEANEGSNEAAEAESEKHEAEEVELGLVEIKARGVEIR